LVQNAPGRVRAAPYCPVILNKYGLEMKTIVDWCKKHKIT